MTEAIPEPEWFKWATGEPPTVLKVWDGAPTLFLAPTDRGAIVWWEFDQGADDSRYILIAHLTEAEAQAVFEAPTGVGALEPVRGHMEDDRAVVARRHPAGCETERLVRIPAAIPEKAFGAFLDRLQDELAKEELPHPHHRRGASDIARTRKQPHSDESRLDVLARLVSA